LDLLLVVGTVGTVAATDATDAATKARFFYITFGDSLARDTHSLSLEKHFSESFNENLRQSAFLSLLQCILDLRLEAPILVWIYTDSGVRSAECGVVPTGSSSILLVRTSRNR
jgi:hypothetical protein